MNKKKKTETVQLMKLARQYVGALEQIKQSTVRATESEVKLRTELATAASSWPTLGPEEKLTLKNVLELIPDEVSLNVVGFLSSQPNGRAEKPAQRTPPRHEQVTAEK